MNLTSTVGGYNLKAKEELYEKTRSLKQSMSPNYLFGKEEDDHDIDEDDSLITSNNNMSLDLDEDEEGIDTN